MIIKNTLLERIVNIESLRNAIGDYYKQDHAQELHQRNRLLKIVNHFTDSDKLNVYRAPGRIELLGNHTDHQHGDVLCAAIDDDVVGVVHKRTDNVVRMIDVGWDDCAEFNLNDFSCTTGESWKKYAYEIICGFGVDKLAGQGFDLVFHSDIAPGSGVSSSAGLGILWASVINSEYNVGLDNTALSKLCQGAEHRAWNKKVGLMDQNASVRGGANYLSFSDPENPIVFKMAHLAKDLNSEGYCIVVVDTGGDHEGLSDAYNLIKSDMQAAAEVLGCEYLGGLPLSTWASLAKTLETEGVPERIYKRARHFFSEMERLLYFKKTISADITSKKLIEVLLKCVNESGVSSEMDLANLYHPGFSKEDINQQPLAMGYHIAKEFVNQHGGAARLHGGGFAGTVLAIIKKDDTESYFDLQNKQFGNNSAKLYEIRSGAGMIVF